MALYFADTEITGIKDLFPLSSKDIIGLYFADTELFTVWGEYDGTLPATYSANGSTLADYRIYGSAGGVGDRTVNLFDIKTAVMGEYWIDDKYDTFTYHKGSKCYFIPTLANTSYTVTDFTRILPSGTFVFRAAFTNEIPTAQGSNIGVTYRKQRIDSTGGSKHVATLTNANYAYLAVQITAVENNNAVINEGTTAPSEYVPYGYEVPMGVRSANLFDYSDLETGSISVSDGTNVNNAGQKRTIHYIDVNPSSQYMLRNPQGSIRVHEYTISNVWIRSTLVSPNTFFILSNNTAKIRLAASAESFTIQTIICQFFTVTPIFIGDTPLGEDEYVSFKEQKVYRRTKQLFNAETAVYKNGYYKNDYGDERTYPGAGCYTTYIPIAPGETIYVTNVSGSNDLTARLYFYDAQKQWILRTDGYTNDFSVVTPSNAAYAQLQISKVFIPSPNTITITQGSTAPSTYIPYYDQQDPPVPLPALPTVDGTNIVDYAGQSAAVPERVEMKYRKEGFK